MLALQEQQLPAPSNIVFRVLTTMSWLHIFQAGFCFLLSVCNLCSAEMFDDLPYGHQHGGLCADPVA